MIAQIRVGEASTVHLQLKRGAKKLTKAPSVQLVVRYKDHRVIACDRGQPISVDSID